MQTNRTVRPRPTVNVKYGTSDLLNVQYHVANVAANTISPRAVTKKMVQKKPTKLTAYENWDFNFAFTGSKSPSVHCSPGSKSQPLDF